ncbi:hypothetical protein N7491_008014 [Penicillium cf. griseofulvum]|uniref:Pectate lyase n=1 Tax=Penicillium cf. griseofulvum TaxID=2972120 RepID=A0A9W9J7Y6_9EURO|nr:hypothetical protein N7472_008959 [Penicillium cf. griseofulvum]KAJ5427572.1 hypothetical protein N7491_008014 [Penicillium cf. griseofulvum]KAJ5431769.1 hypothetical protein N7445_008267 [Penicillium cf. griseofulvum]
MNLPRRLCGLLALSAVGLSLPKIIDVTAENFVNIEEIYVGADGTSINQTRSDMVCGGGCQPSFSYTKVGNGDPHQNFVIT